jgi:hypothetical protein
MGGILMSNVYDYVTSCLEESEAIELPDNWNELKSRLTPGEIIVYEKYNNSETEKRRNSLSKTYKKLSEMEESSTEAKELLNASFTFLRCAYLHTLMSTNIYKPGITDILSICVNELTKSLNELDNKYRGQIDKILSKYKDNIKFKKLTIKRTEEGAIYCFKQLSLQFKIRENLNSDGVNRKRFRHIIKNISKEKKT